VQSSPAFPLFLQQYVQLHDDPAAATPVHRQWLPPVTMPKQMALLVAGSIALVLLSLDRQRQWLTWWTTATTTFAALSAMTLQPRSASASLTLYQP